MLMRDDKKKDGWKRAAARDGERTRRQTPLVIVVRIGSRRRVQLILVRYRDVSSPILTN